MGTDNLFLYNKRKGRHGPLWEQRFKNILVEHSEHALLTLAAYIELNAVRAGLVADPKCTLRDLRLQPVLRTCPQ